MVEQLQMKQSNPKHRPQKQKKRFRRVVRVLSYCVAYAVLLNVVFVRYSYDDINGNNDTGRRRRRSTGGGGGVTVVEATWSPHFHPQQKVNIVTGASTKPPSLSVDFEVQQQQRREHLNHHQEETEEEESESWWGMFTSYLHDQKDDVVDPVRSSLNRFRREVGLQQRQQQQQEGRHTSGDSSSRLSSFWDLNGRPPRGGSMSSMVSDDVNYTDHHQQQHKQPLDQQVYEQRLQRYQQQYHENYDRSLHQGTPTMDPPATTVSADAQQEQQQQQQLDQQHQTVYAERRVVQTVQYTGQQQYQEQPVQKEVKPQEQEKPFVPPNVQIKHVSLALHVTSEWNRRLSHGINRFRIWSRKFAHEQNDPIDNNGVGNVNDNNDNDHRRSIYHSSTHGAVPPGGQQEQQNVDQYYGQRPINVHPSRVWHPPIPMTMTTSQSEDVDEETNEELTVFHAKHQVRRSTSSSLSTSVVSKQCDGVRNWGPDMEPYLEGLVELFSLKPETGSSKTENDDNNEGMIELPLAMIYLDRACSVDTPRTLYQGYRQETSTDGKIRVVAPCPFCSPRTVHRLALAALLLAIESVRGTQQMEKACQGVIEEVSKASTSDSRSSSSVSLLPSDLTADQLLHMVQWMKAALGDAGQLVSVEEMRA
eukprot:CAMPEP_0113478042 /NCGR_PEP_ID=MMETSP0014_2-20120614/20531_1 /TAXON_ID=2857 /ORGANISM="Nitzschia sp." /LENGTH=645 /DNA_ID=CAMNT_0000371179 /DNA_START=76 /DNA_END=2009 /DNA_ORIENTATION=+ /assembly_acc=CAM_ASM_000159